MRGPQLNIRGLSVDEIKEFDEARKGLGPEGTDLSRWLFFKKVWREWKAATAAVDSAAGAPVETLEIKHRGASSLGHTSLASKSQKYRRSASGDHK